MNSGSHLFVGRRGRALATLVAVLCVVAAGWWSAHVRTDPQLRFQLSSGAAWLAWPDRGILDLVDGLNDRIVAEVRLGDPIDSNLSLVQDGESALVANGVAGNVRRVSGATLTVLPHPVVTLAPNHVLTLLLGGSGAYAVDHTSRLVRWFDVNSGAVGRSFSVNARPTEGQSLADPTGRLWVVDSEKGELWWFSEVGEPSDQLKVDARAQLILVNGRPVLVDSGANAGSIAWLSPDGSVSP